ncbi:SIMPL domain-containing protein [Aureibacillus halotolerans]|uniref:SIMPL domain-containing protein n=1 Tax=Aureibacillus halotolerans TaxID=1508390 RepID=UPI001414E260|nr:SIMPL domain-containing protein [Aureibacillus halotolerans]
MKRKTITVTGHAEASAPPDTVQLTIGVTTEGKSVSVVQKENARAIDNIMTALKREGVSEQLIQTATYQISPQYDYVDGKQVFRGYRVTHLLDVTVRDVSNVGNIIDAAVAAGANEISSVQFTVEDADLLQQQALRGATLNAIEKADSIADALKVELNETPISVVELTQNIGQPKMVMFQAAESTQLQPGTFTLYAQVEAVFEYSQAQE